MVKVQTLSAGGMIYKMLFNQIFWSPWIPERKPRHGLHMQKNEIAEYAA